MFTYLVRFFFNGKHFPPSVKLKLEIWGKFLGTSPSFEVGDFHPKASNFHPKRVRFQRHRKDPLGWKPFGSFGRGVVFHGVPFKEKFGEVRWREVLE